MKTIHKFLLAACIPVLGLAACGGSDTADRLDVADPVVRFVHAASDAGNLTLYRAADAQPDATNVAYKFASNYFDVDLGTNDWLVKTATIPPVTVGTVPINPIRGNRYTIVALPALGSLLIIDPYNKSLGSSSSRLRVVNASPSVASVDLFMTALGADIAGVNPTIGGTAYKFAGPASGGDSQGISSSTYQVTITATGTKTPILFKGQLAFGENQDILLLTVPDPLVPGAIKALVKIDGTPGATDVTPLP
jgi:Domain of unknown function (DUF4397)